MSANIYYRPIESGRKELETGSSSSFIKAMENTFGSGSGTGKWILSEKDVPCLKGMSGVSEDEVYNDIAEAIDKCGQIEIFVEY